MGIGVSLLLIAVGLILALAVHSSVSGVDISLVGWILAIVGFTGLVIALTFVESLPRRRRY
jgi:uncharacterized membrane protein